MRISVGGNERVLTITFYDDQIYNVPDIYNFTTDNFHSRVLKKSPDLKGYFSRLKKYAKGSTIHKCGLIIPLEKKCPFCTKSSWWGVDNLLY